MLSYNYISQWNQFKDSPRLFPRSVCVWALHCACGWGLVEFLTWHFQGSARINSKGQWNNNLRFVATLLTGSLPFPTCRLPDVFTAYSPSASNERYIMFGGNRWIDTGDVLILTPSSYSIKMANCFRVPARSIWFLRAEKEKGDHYLPETSVCATSPLLSRPIFFPPSVSLLPIKIEFVCHFTWST